MYVYGTVWIDYEIKNYQIQKFKYSWFGLNDFQKNIRFNFMFIVWVDCLMSK